MKRGIILLAACIGIALLITLIIQHSTQAQRPDTAGDRSPRRRPEEQRDSPQRHRGHRESRKVRKWESGNITCWFPFSSRLRV